MKPHRFSRIFLLTSLAALFLLLFTGGIPASHISADEPGLFESDDILSITLKGNLKDLLNDRTGVARDFPLVISYTGADDSEIELPVEMKTRGHFRRMKENCTYPPLLIQFPKEGPHLRSVFREQRKLKLVMPCRGEEYLIREWLVYKLYNLVTPYSFRARLVKVKLEEQNKKPGTPFYGILLEEEKQMAKRNKATAVDQQLRPEQTQTAAFLDMTVFEYLIGNTDWSVQYQHNIKLLVTDSVSTPITVPYDFDHSGMVNAPYARPAEQLLMNSVKERRYRGYCMDDLSVFEPVIAKYNRLKNDIYAVYTGCKLLDEKYLKSTLQYLDAFYTTINNPKTWRKEFGYPCDKNGTGNVVIRGLREE